MHIHVGRGGDGGEEREGTKRGRREGRRKNGTELAISTAYQIIDFPKQTHN